MKTSYYPYHINIFITTAGAQQSSIFKKVLFWEETGFWGGNSFSTHLIFPIWVQEEIQSFGGNFQQKASFTKFPFSTQQQEIKTFNEDFARF